MSPTVGEARATLISDAKSIVEQFWQGTHWGRSQFEQHLPGARTLGDSLKSKDERIESVNRIRFVIENNRDELMREAGTLILTYLERYKVKSDTADPFKLAFWFGIALSGKVGEVNDLDKRVVLLTTIGLLDIFCHAHCSRCMPIDMRSKMNMSIAEGKNIEEFGHHGLYHSFKSLAKAYSDNEIG